MLLLIVNRSGTQSCVSLPTWWLALKPGVVETPKTTNSRSSYQCCRRYNGCTTTYNYNKIIRRASCRTRSMMYEQWHIFLSIHVFTAHLWESIGVGWTLRSVWTLLDKLDPCFLCDELGGGSIGHSSNQVCLYELESTCLLRDLCACSRCLSSALVIFSSQKYYKTQIDNKCNIIKEMYLRCKGLWYTQTQTILVALG